MLEGVAGILNVIKEFFRYGEDADRQVFSSFTKALNATSDYINDLDNGSQPDREREREIAELWRLLSIDLRSVDSPLARTVWMKSRYWIKGAKMEAAELSARGIRLQQMEETLDQVLRRGG